MDSLFFRAIVTNMHRTYFYCLFVLPLLLGLFACVPGGLGLDVRGGTRLVFEADLSDKDPPVLSDEEAMARVQQTIKKRIESLAGKAIIEREGTDRLIVQLPKLGNIDEVIKTISKPARLTFQEQATGPDGQPQLDEKGEPKWKPATAISSNGEESALTGRYLKPNSHVKLRNGEAVLAFEFDKEGSVLMKQITTRLVPQARQLGIFLDNELLSAPRVLGVIEDKGIIDGLTLEEAKNLALQLNSGALEVPLKLLQQEPIP